MKVLLLAGEESGLVYAERLRGMLERLVPDAVFRGYQSEGFRTGDLAVMGFLPVLRKLFYFLGVARTMKRVIREWRPDVVVTVDYPGLNLKLAAYAKGLGIPAVHVVCPQVWAWHRGRIPKVEAALTKLLCFFPFEPALFSPGFAAFIGHPMVDIFADEEHGARSSSAAAGDALVAVLPGSRVGEIRRILPRLVKAVEGMNWRIPAANDRAYEEIARVLKTCGCADWESRVQRGGARELLRRARCAAVASGTATLEAALARCPTVLVYAVSASLAWFARHVIREISHIGIVNVIAEKTGTEPPTPELLQEAFTPEAVRRFLCAWLSDDAACGTARRKLDDTLRALVSDGDAFGNAAREILAVTACNGRPK